MRIAIMGAGSIAYGTAAYLANEGHDLVLWSPSGQRARGLAAGEPLVAKGAVEFSGPVAVAGAAAEAVQGADVVIVALPVNGHRMVLDAIAPHLTPEQTVIISSHGSFGALYLSRLLAGRGITVPIVAGIMPVSTKAGRPATPRSTSAPSASGWMSRRCRKPRWITGLRCAANCLETVLCRATGCWRSRCRT